MFNLHFAALLVEFSPAIYIVTEGDSVLIGLALNLAASFDVAVAFTTSDIGQATGTYSNNQSSLNSDVPCIFSSLNTSYYTEIATS